MRETAAALPTPDEAVALHRRLLDGDRVAPAEIATAYLDWLAADLARRNPRADPSHCDTAAEDAILALLEHPAAYDPARGDLASYLRMAAWRDLQNLSRAEKRHSQRRADLAVVEFSPAAGKYLWDESDEPSRVLEEREEAMNVQATLDPLLDAARAGLSPGEVQALDLLRQGERKTAPYAAALGLAHLPEDEQRRAVKRVKDKLKKRLTRAGDGHV